MNFNQFLFKLDTILIKFFNLFASKKIEDERVEIETISKFQH